MGYISNGFGSVTSLSSVTTSNGVLTIGQLNAAYNNLSGLAYTTSSGTTLSSIDLNEMLNPQDRPSEKKATLKDWIDAHRKKEEK